jgi:hypothetical protein
MANASAAVQPMKSRAANYRRNKLIILQAIDGNEKD